MSGQDLKEKIEVALKHGTFRDPHDLVDVTDGPADDIHVVVVSRKFDDLPTDRRELIWSDLMTKLKPEEWGKVTLSIAVSPQQLKRMHYQLH